MLRRTMMTIGRWGARLPIQIGAIVLLNMQVWQSSEAAQNPATAVNPGKNLCLPVLNCHACPTSTTACPIGSITLFAQRERSRFPYFVIGLIGLICLALGRALCGWACPFGFVQDALYRIKTPKVRVPTFANGAKYLVLFGLVAALPFVLGDESMLGSTERIQSGKGAYDFCATVCPVGTLEAGIPAAVSRDPGDAPLGARFYAKAAVLATVLLGVIFMQRAFCRVLCPLGALTVLLSRFSAFRLKMDLRHCVACSRCVKACPVDAIKVSDAGKPSRVTSECVMCLECVKVCSAPGAISAEWFGRPVAVSKPRMRGKVVCDVG
jgi:ferredoxin